MAKTDVDSTSVAVGDDYQRLVDLIGIPGLRGRIKDALLTFDTSGVTVGYNGGGVPPAAGNAVAAGSGLSWSNRSVGWLIENVWLKESTAGGGATAIFSGVIDVA